MESFVVVSALSKFLKHGVCIIIILVPGSVSYGGRGGGGAEGGGCGGVGVEGGRGSSTLA